MDWVSLTSITDIGAGALVTLFTLAILTGRLRPQKTIEEIRQDRDARLADLQEYAAKTLEVAELYRQAYQITEQTRTETLQRIEEQQESIERAIVILTKHVADLRDGKDQDVRKSS